MKPCYFAQWDAGKSPNCTWTQGERVCQQYPALTSAFMCYPVRQGRAFFIVPFIIKNHAMGRQYYQRGPDCSFPTWFLSDDSSVQSGWKCCPWWRVTWTASSVASPVWHSGQDNFHRKAKLRQTFREKTDLFSTCSLRACLESALGACITASIFGVLAGSRD